MIFYRPIQYSKIVKPATDRQGLMSDAAYASEEFEEIEAFLERLKSTETAPAKRPLRPFDPDQDEWGWQQEED